MFHLNAQYMVIGMPEMQKIVNTIKQGNHSNVIGSYIHFRDVLIWLEKHRFNRF